ncbi:MAG: SURF1 family protein [Rhodobacteraceae bacterium]|nr:SURF1 family protein [Paracoccaceae bacterium]
MPAPPDRLPVRKVIAALAFGLGGVAILLALGIWQVQRLAWKTEIIDRIEARLAADPVPLPAAPSPGEDQFLRVRATGRIGGPELHVYTSAPPRGVGYRVIVALELAEGRRILLDRGFVPIEEKDAARHEGEITVEGALLWPQETDYFTSEPDRAKNVWFARDVDLMADALRTEPVLLVVSASDDPAAPMPLPVTVNIPNDHLGYAITWFGLALVWAVMTGYLLWRIKRRTD